MVPGVEVIYPVQVNGVFSRLPREAWQALQQEFFFYDWDFDRDEVRWMCSFDTTDEDITAFVTVLKKVMSNISH